MAMEPAFRDPERDGFLEKFLEEFLRLRHIQVALSQPTFVKRIRDLTSSSESEQPGL